MSFLSTFFEREDIPDYNELTRHSSAIGGTPNYYFVFYDAELIHDGDNFNIFRGRLWRSDINKGRPAVVKLGWKDSHPDAEDSLEYEYQMYKGPLRKLQGKIVPDFIGLFQGDTQTEHGVVTALLLEDLGEPDNKTLKWKNATPDQKIDLIQTIVRLHAAGVQHNDLSADNLILKDNKWFIIDFEDATRHECKRKMKILEGSICPDVLDFGCSEIWDWTRALGVWRTGTIRLFGKLMPEDAIQSKDNLRRFAYMNHLVGAVPHERLEREIDNIWEYLICIRSREDKCQPRKYWYYLGES